MIAIDTLLPYRIGVMSRLRIAPCTTGHYDTLAIRITSIIIIVEKTIEDNAQGHHASGSELIWQWVLIAYVAIGKANIAIRHFHDRKARCCEDRSRLFDLATDH